MNKEDIFGRMKEILQPLKVLDPDKDEKLAGELVVYASAIAKVLPKYGKIEDLMQLLPLVEQVHLAK